jgi:hypothetical protein
MGTAVAPMYITPEYTRVVRVCNSLSSKKRFRPSVERQLLGVFSCPAPQVVVKRVRFLNHLAVGVGGGG